MEPLEDGHEVKEPGIEKLVVVVVERLEEEEEEEEEFSPGWLRTCSSVGLSWGRTESIHRIRDSASAGRGAKMRQRTSIPVLPLKVGA